MRTEDAQLFSFSLHPLNSHVVDNLDAMILQFPRNHLTQVTIYGLQYCWFIRSTDNNSSTIVQYKMDGTQGNKFTVPGHSDGMRIDPATHLLWVSSCEDGNSKFITIDPSSGTITPYTFPVAPHGGGYDDLCFVNGMVFIAASNPNVNAAGVNVFPAIDKISLSNGKASLTPVLMGNASATDLTTHMKVSLNEVDPDSMTVDSKGELVLTNQ